MGEGADMSAASEAITVSATEGSDVITALYPLDILTKQRTGAHPGKRFTPDTKTDFDMPLFFAAEDVSFADVREMHRVLCDIAEAGQAFVVRARRAHKGSFIRRTKTRKGNCPAGLRGSKVRAFPIDCDKWPNVMRLDPRTDPVATWRWMIGLLGPEFADITVSAHWSSSCCARTAAGEAPATLDARFWLMLDTALGEQGCRDLLNLLNRRVRAYFESCSIEMAKRHKPVDPKLADAQQPIYLATPIFEGLADPLPIRRALLEGTSDVVRTADLWAAMPKTVIVDTVSVHETKTAASKAKRAPKAVSIPGGVLPLAASARLVAAQREVLDAAVRGEGAEAYRATCQNLFDRRVALEMTALAVHRGGLVGTGTSDHYCTMIASAYVASLPLRMPTERVRAEVQSILVLVAGPEWVDAEWTGTADASVIDRYRRASAGEVGDYGRDLRYGYSKRRLLEEWLPTYQEILDLGLRSLCSDADRVAAERDAERAVSGGLAREDWLAAARARAPEVHRLRAEGMSLRKIVDATGLPISKVQRLLVLSADEVAELAQDVAAPVPTSVSVVADVEQVPSAGHDPLPGAIRYAMASAGVGTPNEVAGLIGEPVGLVEMVMIEMGLWGEPEEIRLAA